MRRPLAGKRAFEAMGHSDCLSRSGQRTKDWPEWAVRAYQRGFENARFSNAMQTVKTWPIHKVFEQSAKEPR